MRVTKKKYYFNIYIIIIIYILNISSYISKWCKDVNDVKDVYIICSQKHTENVDFFRAVGWQLQLHEWTPSLKRIDYRAARRPAAQTAHKTRKSAYGHRKSAYVHQAHRYLFLNVTQMHRSRLREKPQKTGHLHNPVFFFLQKQQKHSLQYVSDFQSLQDARWLFFLVSMLPDKNIRLASVSPTETPHTLWAKTPIVTQSKKQRLPRWLNNDVKVIARQRFFRLEKPMFLHSMLNS